MKYLSKPPLFPEQERHEPERSTTENIKEFIEAQKLKTIERDQRDLLDTFIGLLKNYTEEVQTAMSSFKDSLSSSLSKNTANAEQITSAARKSFSVVDELKKDFKSNFDQLKMDIEENKELRDIISKKEQDVALLKRELKIQKDQIGMLQLNQANAIEREEKFKQREKQLLERIKEAERSNISVFKETPPPSQRQEPQIFYCNALHCNSQGKENTMTPNQEAVKHVGPCCGPPPRPITYQACNDKGFPRSAVKYSRSKEVTGAHQPLQSNYAKLNRNFPIDRVEPMAARAFPITYTAKCPLSNDSKNQNTPYSANTNVGVHQPAMAVYPIASIAPIQIPSSPIQCFQAAKTCASGQKSSQSLILPAVGHALYSDSPERSGQMTNAAQPLVAPSPLQGVLTKSKRPKQSPVATVLPQVQEKQKAIILESKQNHDDNNKGNDVIFQGKNFNQGKKQQEDPFGIFTLDLTISPPYNKSVKIDSRREAQPARVKLETPRVPEGKDQSSAKCLKREEPRKKKHKTVEEKPMRKYDTRSRGKANLNQSGNSVKSTLINLKRKVYSSAKGNSSRVLCSMEITGTNKSPIISHDTESRTTKSKVPYSKEFLGSPFKRRKSEKRTLNLSSLSGSLFGMIDEEVSIHQITESIRKHTQKKKMKQNNDYVS